MNSRKRKFQETSFVDLTGSHEASPNTPPAKKRRLLQSNPSSPTNSHDNKENVHGSANTTSSGSTEINILQHRLEDEYIHFQVVDQNQNTTKWMKHEELNHLPIYSQYLTKNNLSLEEVAEPQYQPSAILDHQWNEESGIIEFSIQWKGYDDITWEPSENLIDNKIYIEYCKKNGIKPLLTTDYSDDDEDDDEDETTYDLEEGQDEEETRAPSAYIDDIIHIESAYNAAQKQHKSFSIEDIEALMTNIDTKTNAILMQTTVAPMPSNHNGEECKKESEIDHHVLLNKLLDIRQYFETLKQQLLCKQFAQMKPMNQTPSNRIRKTKKRTLFDYAFTPTPGAVKCKPKTKALATKAMKAPSKSMRQSHLIESARQEQKEEEIPHEYLQQNSSCYGCKRKWPLFGVEFFCAFRLCKECPPHIRLGYNRKFKEDWFCPYCIHESHAKYPNMSLSVICDAPRNEKPFLYVKPNGSNYWKTYIPLRVLDFNTKRLLVGLKKRSQQKEIALTDIAANHILWAYHDETTRIRSNKDIQKVIKRDGDTVVFKKDGETLTVPRHEVIACSLYLHKLILDTIRQHKQRRITFDRERIFKHSIRIKMERKQRERDKHQFGANTKIIESAPQNSRYFAAADTASEVQETPHYPQTTAQLLDLFGLSCVADHLVEPPRRRLVLADIKQYALVLIVGPSGSGKSTLLADLQAQNPSMVTFKSPGCLVWDNRKCVISQFGDIAVSEAMSNMSSIGLNNVRTWLKPFNILSQGEQYRCAFARLLQQSKGEPNKVIIMDEFTSVLDRTNARCMSAAMSKCIRNNEKKSTFVLASANADIIRYLQPDLLIVLGGDDDMKLIRNPNNNASLFDVRAVLDLPPFKRRKDEGNNEYKSIYPLTLFNDLVPFTAPISVTNEVRQLSCKVMMDAHAKQSSSILDVEDFEGVCLTHIPCLQRKHLRGEFNIGVMCGPSGCGKTSSGERLFGRPRAVQWDKTRNCASHFTSCDDLKELFDAVDLPLSIGFSCFSNLSEGEQHRINIARYLQNDDVLIDEFTSYLDRECAKKVAKGVSDYIYRNDRKGIVFLCCKYDIISASNGMYPSWIFDVPNKKMTHYKRPNSIHNAKHEPILYAKHEFFDIRNLWNPPKIRLVLKPATKYDFSPTFSKYHYMDASISTSAKCWSVWAFFTYDSNKEEADDDDEDGYYEEDELELAGFISVMNHYGQNQINLVTGKKKIDFREHRTVILPAFQGLGFGSRVADCIGEYLALHGLRLHSKTAHPRYGGYRNKQPSLWIPTVRNGQQLSRIAWKKDLDRILFGGGQKSVGHEKQYFIHVYKMPTDKERTNQVEKKLKSRVIVKKQYAFTV